MPAPLLAAGIAAGAGLLGQGISAYSTGKMNKRAENFSREMYARQRQDSLSDWNMQNAYNDPSAQMKRLQDANLNPHLVYGNGATATAESAPRASQQSTPNYQVPKLDVGSVVFNALQAKQLQANIARTEAETRAIDERTIGTEFQNQLNQKIGLDQMQFRYNTEVQKLSTQKQKELQEFEAYLQAGFNNDGVSDASPRVKAIKAGYDLAEQELKNAATRGDIYGSEAAIKRFEKHLTEQGLSPNSPYWLKSIMALVEATGMYKMFNSLPATYEEAKSQF